MGPTRDTIKVTLFDLDHTLLPIDSDHAWGVFTTAIGWTDPIAFAQRNEDFYLHYLAGTLDGELPGLKAAVVKAVVAWVEDQAACWLEGLVSLIGLSGLRWTTSMRVQFRVFPDHRLGCRMRAAAYTATRLLNRDRSICE